jgi:hypothetical protein
MRFFGVLCACVAFGSVALMAPPPDPSTPLRDMGGVRLDFFVSRKGYKLEFLGNQQTFTLKKGLVPCADQSWALGLGEKINTLTIDGVFGALEAYAANAPDKRTYQPDCQINVCGIKAPVHIVSHRAEFFVWRHHWLEIATYHMGQILDLPNVKSPILQGSTFFAAPLWLGGDKFKHSFICCLGYPRQQKGRFRPGTDSPLLKHAGNDLGWSSFLDSSVRFEGLWNRLAISYFAEGQNPLTLREVHPWRAKILESASAVIAPQETPSPDNGEATVEVPAAAKAKGVLAVRPEIEDFGAWLDEVTMAVQVTQLGGYILCDSAYQALEASLTARLEGVDQSAQKAKLEALVNLVPALDDRLDDTSLLGCVGDLLAGPDKNGEVELQSPHVLPHMPPEMWLEIFDFLSAQDQARALTALPFLRQPLGVFMHQRPELAHLIPMTLIKNGAGVALEIGDNYIDILDVSALNLDLSGCVNVRQPRRKVFLPAEGRVILDNLTIHRLSALPTAPRSATMEIVFKPCWRVDEDPAHHKPAVMSAALTLLMSTKERGTFGPLYLQDPATLPHDIKSHPDFVNLTKIILPYLALKECQECSMAKAGIVLKH